MISNPLRSKRSMLPLIVLLVSVVALLPSVGYATNASALSSQWIKYSGNPVLSPTPGGWDANYVMSPRVLNVSSGYSMWYDGGSAGVAAIGYANSTDGISWEKDPQPVLSPGPQGAWDSGQVALGSVLWNGMAFDMWYGGSNTTTYGTGEVGFATSKDGISWVKYLGNPVLGRTLFGLDQNYMTTPYVIKLQLYYYMWYTGRNTTYPQPNPTARILGAMSYDGIHWTKMPTPAMTPSPNPEAWDSGSVYSPAANYANTNFGLWYTGTNQSYMIPQIGFANSPDGENWTQLSDRPILGPGAPGSWDSAGVEQPDVIMTGNGLMMYYDGFSNTTAARIGLAFGSQNFEILAFPPPSFDTAIGPYAQASADPSTLKNTPRNLEDKAHI